MTQTQARYRTALPFRLSPIAATLAGAALLASAPLYAADPTVAELQAEIARLKQQIAAQNPNAAASAPAPVAAEAAPAPAAAPEEPEVLGEVTVRSRNRLERLQDVPLSVSVVTGKELDRLQATDIKSLTQRAANVSWNQGNQRTASLAIRGVGKQGQTEAQDPSVGLIVDGVNYAYNALSSSFDFTDVDAVEVTRGPQGTLLGKNTSVGVVNVTTRRPSFTPDASWSVTIGQQDTVQGRYAAGGPIVDGLLAYRANVSVTKGEGDIKNANNRDLTYTNKDRVSGRLQFLLTPDPSFSARIALDAQPRAGEFTNGRTINTPTPNRYSNGSVNTLATDAATRLARRWFTQQSAYTYEGSYLNGGGQNVVNNDSARPLVTGSNGATAELNWYGATHNLTSITAYKDYHFNATNDEGTPFDIHRNSGGFWNDYKQVTQELRLSSQPGGFVDYQTGIFLMKVANQADYRREWGNDAGAWYANAAQYGRLDADAAGRYLLQSSLDRLAMSFNSPAGTQDIRNKSAAVFAQANWHLSEPLTLTTGLRFTREDRRNLGSTLVNNYGNAPELNPVSVNGVQFGGFDSDANGLLRAGNSAAQVGLADRVAAKYFGAATYAALTAAQKRQVADAKAIRVSQIGVIFPSTEAAPFKDTLPSFVVSPSYKFNKDLTAYASWQYGEKAGISQLTNGVSNLVRKEKTNALEAGFKSALLDRKLLVNANVFRMDIDDYQQAVRVLDVYTTNLNNDGQIYYTTATGNAPKVRAQGLELDGAYNGIANTSLRFSGAYTDAKYKEFPNSAQPVENGYTGAAPYRNVSGEALPGASKWTFNVGADYRRPLWRDKEFHASFNTAYASKTNTDNTLSSYGWIGSSTITDLSVGLGTRSGSFDVSVLVKNAFGNDTPLTRTWNLYTPAVPRWVGLVVSGKL
ncbi:TonB-dependent receptor [Pseudoduganella namucuonensis]|uniref:TonB-dependent Receptor Plug Domain n=1 Tax=Pseudoduganella namucuonensis TaxID=1035707 RepID=A0A1I7JCV5_9BURK|nr:TonB-dependent receptor [Pseudoduganella namucuonensis]SFU82974.1 TonB-dependent Receptor Plug Domain [Pseudoduganella namucuonensis]